MNRRELGKTGNSAGLQNRTESVNIYKKKIKNVGGTNSLTLHRLQLATAMLGFAFKGIDSLYFF